MYFFTYAGAVDVTTHIVIFNSDGTPNTSAGTSPTLYYVRPRSTKVAISLSALGAENSSHTDGGIIHLAGGHYRLDLPDAASATGAESVTIFGTLTNSVIVPTTHILNVSRASQVDKMDQLTINATVVTGTSDTVFTCTLTDRNGSTLNSAVIANSGLIKKSIVCYSVQGGSGIKKYDRASISAATWDSGNSRWNITLDSNDKLTGTPVAGDTFLLSAL